MSRNRLPLRVQKSFDNYRLKTGSAGFIILFKNGQRIQPRNCHINFNVRKSDNGKIGADVYYSHN